MEEIESLISKIHQLPPVGMVAVAGAGSQAVSWLLGVAGASRTLLEVLVPYGRMSMIGFLGHEPAQYVSPQTAQEMAKAAFRRAGRLRESPDTQIFGLACTATIATDRPKRGDHRASLAAWDETQVVSYNLRFDKGRRNRAGEEETVSRMLIQALAQLSGITADIPLGLTDGDDLEIEQQRHDNPVQQLLAGTVSTITVYPDGRMAADEPVSAALMPGSFRPLHQGHEQLAQTASNLLGVEAVFELSVINVDKPPLDEAEVMRRIGQFRGKRRVVLTRAETFRKKANYFPGSIFIIGWDTAVRLVEPQYYGNNKAAMLQALAEMWAAGCRFLVAGREYQGQFHTLKDVPIPAGFESLFQAIPEDRFRVDISSTAIRNGG